MNKLIFVCLFFLALVPSCKPKKEEKPPIKIEIAEVIKQDVKDYIEAIGNVYEYSIVDIRPQVQGILLNVYVKQGDFVKPGDLLFQIDPRPYIQSLDEAKATLEKDKATLEMTKSTVRRYTEAAQKDFIAPINFEQYLTNLAMAEAQVAVDAAAVEIAKINLDYCTIRAPIAGKVGIYNIYPGNLVVVNDQNALIQIRQITPVDIRFSIPQRDFQEVQRDEKTMEYTFEVFLPYEENQKFEGCLYFVDNHINLQTGMILLKGAIQNEELKLWPGQYVRTRLFTKVLKDALVIPSAAIQVGQKGHFVYRVKPDMTVEAVYVSLGPKSNGNTVVFQGLDLNDRVVTNGQINLREGARVIPKQPEELEFRLRQNPGIDRS